MRAGLTVATAMAFAAVAPVAASEGGGGGAAALIQPQIGTIFWTIVTFVLLAFLLGKVAWKPLLRAIEERERSIEGSLRQARLEREQAQALLDEHRALIAQAHRERADAVEKGREEADRLRSEMLEEARRQREHILAQTDDQIRASVKQARNELRRVAVDLAIEAAGKLLTRNLDDASQRKLVEEHLADLESGGGAAGRAS